MNFVEEILQRKLNLTISKYVLGFSSIWKVQVCFPQYENRKYAMQHGQRGLEKGLTIGFGLSHQLLLDKFCDSSTTSMI